MQGVAVQPEVVFGQEPHRSARTLMVMQVEDGAPQMMTPKIVGCVKALPWLVKAVGSPDPGFAMDLLFASFKFHICFILKS